MTFEEGDCYGKMLAPSSTCQLSWTCYYVFTVRLVKFWKQISLAFAFLSKSRLWFLYFYCFLAPDDESLSLESTRNKSNLWYLRTSTYERMCMIVMQLSHHQWTLFLIVFFEKKYIESAQKSSSNHGKSRKLWNHILFLSWRIFVGWFRSP